MALLHPHCPPPLLPTTIGCYPMAPSLRPPVSSSDVKFGAGRSPDLSLGQTRRVFWRNSRVIPLLPGRTASHVPDWLPTEGQDPRCHSRLRPFGKRKKGPAGDPKGCQAVLSVHEPRIANLDVLLVSRWPLHRPLCLLARVGLLRNARRGQLAGQASYNAALLLTLVSLQCLVEFLPQPLTGIMCFFEACQRQHD